MYWEDETGRDIKIAEIPDEAKAPAEEARRQMLERIAELDDELTVKYLEGDTISVNEMKQALRKAVLDNRATPIFCGSAMRNKGVQALLDAVID
ncbi:MAG: elongation factor G, partial [Anaerolineales bacterium]|nr:elongation factor G [Anaerolineales bacterium]